MANPAAITEGGTGLKLPLLVGTSGTPYLPAAGDNETMAGGWDSDRAPALVQAMKATAAVPTTVASSASSVTILAANPVRKGATIVNESTQILYLKLGSGPATNANYTAALPAMSTIGAYYEVPYGFNGIITGIWASANGNARVTELS